ncbi:MAG: cytochrome c3 family protein [candidate division Zixibacteria bacterium]|nr:cytochrome c3 family protein [candidate division Zixibacteria bacterium]MBU1469144.1 cytochrome c3 family protein [candidate division Zixibacteria bacterium]MBU2624856.1 cytochrome c3 family protein [candidate division Zixibacteria bacterium]
MCKRDTIVLLAAIIIALMLPWFAYAQEPKNTCVECHLQLDDELLAPAEAFENDVHNRLGVLCVGCHGGDSAAEDADDAMSKQMGFIGAPSPLEIPKLCSKCHADPVYIKTFNPQLPTDQYSKYLTSMHGVKNLKGDQKVAQCASCHRAHDIRAANDPKSSVYAINIPATCAHCHADSVYMAGRGIPTNQMEQYASSVHGVALLEKHDVGAPACNSCHGNHGAMPPGITSIERVCGLCHANNMTFFEESTHFEYFQGMNARACETCHSNHAIAKPSIEMLAGEHSVCLQCHDPKDGTGGIEAAMQMRMAIDSLSGLIDDVNARLDDADQKGLYVTNALFTLKDATQNLFEAKTAVHILNADSVSGITLDGDKLAQQASVVADGLLADYVVRRIGLAVSVVVLLFLALLIWIKVRRIETRQKLR